MAAKRRAGRRSKKELARKVATSLTASSNTEAVNRALRTTLPARGAETALDAKRREREKKRERKKMQEASLKMDALAKRLGRWDAQAIIRKFRDTNLKGDA
ncbi:MAG TPA: hypothetical protein VGK77_14420 [Candidatus Binatia bacterium]